jgi:hypothetical protein
MKSTTVLTRWPTGSTRSTPVAISMSRTGSRIVKTVMPNPGSDRPAAGSLNCAAIAPVGTNGTRAAYMRAIIGPAIAATGRPTMRE